MTTDAQIEATYAYASGDVEVATFEVRHPSIQSETGDEGVIRIASAFVPPSELAAAPYFEARLEPDAPLNAGEVVKFIRAGVALERPERSTTAAPQALFRVQNVDARIGTAFQLVARSAEPAACTIRTFTESTRLVGQPEVLTGLELVDPEINMVEVTVRAQGPDVVNIAFHLQRYDRRFPLLAHA